MKTFHVFYSKIVLRGFFIKSRQYSEHFGEFGRSVIVNMAQRNTYATELTVTSTLNAEVSDFVPGDQGAVIAPASDREVAQDGYSPGLYNNPPSMYHSLNYSITKLFLTRSRTVQRTLSTRRDSAASFITNPFETDENEYYGPQLLLDEVPCRINSVGDREYFINYQGIKATAFESSHQEQLYPPTHRTGKMNT